MKVSVRTIFGLTALVLCTISAAEAADSASGELQVRGSAARVCQMPDPTAVNSGNASVQSMTITVNDLVNQQDSTIQAWQVSLNYPGVMCNYGATLSLRSLNGGMKIVGPAVQPVGGSFLTQVNYTATAKWGILADLTLDTAANGTDPVSLQAPGANQADLLVSLQTPASTTPLVEGQFQDTLIIKVGPSV
jgi:hypothetical protein